MDSDSPCVGSSAFYAIFNDSLAQSQELANLVTTTIFFGIATALAIASVYILVAKGFKQVSTALQLAAILVLYTSTATFTGAELRAACATANQVQAAANAISKCDTETVFNPLTIEILGDKLACIQTATLIVNVIVGDSVVWWRVYMLWAGEKAKRVILGVSVLLLVATFAISVVDTCGVCNLNLSLTTTTPGRGELFSGTTFGVVAASMSLATNVIATCFTAYRAWAHVRLLKDFNWKLTLTDAEKILIFVAESGFIYSAIWVVVVVWQAGEDTLESYAYETSRAGFWNVVSYFVDGGLVPVIAIYPMFIIVMVALRRTQTDRTYMFPTEIRFNSEAQTASSLAPTAPVGSHVSECGLVIGKLSAAAGSTRSDLAIEESEVAVKRVFERGAERMIENV